MHIEEIEAHLVKSKNAAITAADVDPQVAQDIALAPPPDPAMGDRGFPCFALARHLRKSPAIIATEIADFIRENLDDNDIISEVTTAGPYVNLRLNPARLSNIVLGQALLEKESFGSRSDRDDRKHFMVEFSAPNTNKPQHVGHVRNNLIGDAISRILSATGQRITPVNLINDRGIHICKSMLAYELFGNGETPASSGEKGDHLVGRYYVLFNQKITEEYSAWQKSDEAEARFQEWLDASESEGSRETFFAQYSDKFFNAESELGQQAREMLRKWEEGDPAVVELWKTMNAWVIAGFDETYERLGVSFEHVYLESQTYELGKSIVEEGLKADKFDKLPDGAIVCDLEKVGLEGQKVLLRGDGTSVYMTQDLGTAVTRFDEYDLDQMIYVVGDEQQYHFDVLFRILAFLRPELEGRLQHLAYGMVELPEGKMKSREGKVVDADDLLDEMEELARVAVGERYDDLDDEEIEHRARTIGLAALKYYILDFAPRTTVHFDPAQSIDFQGRTGPYCLYSYARISSIERRLQGWPELDEEKRTEALGSLHSELELALIRHLQQWPYTIELAAEQLSPSRITEYLFHLSKAFSTLYNDPQHRIVDIEGPRRDGLLYLSQAVQYTIGAGLQLLGIPTLNEM